MSITSCCWLLKMESLKYICKAYAPANECYSMAHDFLQSIIRKKAAFSNQFIQLIQVKKAVRKK